MDSATLVYGPLADSVIILFIEQCLVKLRLLKKINKSGAATTIPPYKTRVLILNRWCQANYYGRAFSNWPWDFVLLIEAWLTSTPA